ncbi:cytochrome c biogenesis protein CcdA [Corynebacterium hesseae]
MLSTLFIGFTGGLITGISPCILPVLPLVLAVSGGSRWRPWQVVGGLVTSFSLVTLFATTLLNSLGLPADILWKVGIVLLVLVGLGMVFPRVQEILEWPFQKLPKAGSLQSKARGKGGFVVGLAMGVVFVPCAGPVLAAISVAGATGTVDAHILALCLSFALGVAIPLLAFALGGNEVGKRVDAFRSHQRGVRITAGVVVIVMAGAISLGAPAWLQQKLPSINADATPVEQATSQPKEPQCPRSRG